MSMYNLLFGENKDFDALLGILGLTKEKIGRYRDIYVSKDGEKIILFTRLGGGNRESHETNIKYLTSHKNYLKDYDDPVDDTYAYFEFSIPEGRENLCKYLSGKEVELVGEKFKKEAELLDKKDPEALKRAEKVMDKIAEGVIMGNVIEL